MNWTRAQAIGAFLVLAATLATTGAGPGCRRPQPGAAGPAGAADAREAAGDAKADAERVRPNVAVPEAPRAEAPKRPASVPAEAFWVGGLDGGVFVLIERAHDRRGPFVGKIYHPDGELWYAGPLVPSPRGAPIDPTHHDQFAGWDGERLLMSDGRWLESVRTKRGHTREP